MWREVEIRVIDIEVCGETVVEVLIFDLEEIVDVGILIDKEIHLEVSLDFDAAVAR